MGGRGDRGSRDDDSQINAELRWLIYEQGITDVTVRDPSAGTP